MSVRLVILMDRGDRRAAIDDSHAIGQTPVKDPVIPANAANGK
jgi:hypothetical protein